MRTHNEHLVRMSQVAAEVLVQDIWGMPCTQCARSAKFWMSANTRTLVLAPFHKFLVPYQGFFGFPSIWDVAYLNCQPFPPRRGPSTKCTQSNDPDLDVVIVDTAASLVSIEAVRFALQSTLPDR